MNPLLVDDAWIGRTSEAEKIFVGKRGGAPSMEQGEITALLVRLAREGKRVVRLKGGDPLVFGRGGEEAIALAAAGLAFEIVPGVTAGVAAPAYAGIPVTHRGVSTSVTFITGHEDPGKDKRPNRLVGARARRRHARALHGREPAREDRDCAHRRRPLAEHAGGDRRVGNVSAPAHRHRDARDARARRPRARR